MYSKNCDAYPPLNDARKCMFTNGLKDLDSIPPTQHAFFQHAKRGLLTAAFVWKQAQVKTPEIPIPSDWVGNGMPEPKSGCHTGQIWQMSARLALCSSTVDVLLPVWATVHTIELDSAVVHCASVMVAALIITVIHNYLHELLEPQVIIALV